MDRGPRQCSQFGSAAFAGKLVLVKIQPMARFPTIHAAFVAMRCAVLGRQAPMLGLKVVALYSIWMPR